MSRLRDHGMADRPPTFDGRVDHGCGCPLGMLIGLGAVSFGMLRFNAPPWLAFILLIPVAVLLGAIVSLLFDAVDYGGRVLSYRLRRRGRDSRGR